MGLGPSWASWRWLCDPWGCCHHGEPCHRGLRIVAHFLSTVLPGWVVATPQFTDEGRGGGVQG